MSKQPSEAQILLAMHLKELGLPFEQERQFHDGRKWRLDFYIPDFRIGVEVEGGIWTTGRHTRGAGYQSDLEKYNCATMEHRIRIVRFSSADVLSGRAKEQLHRWLYSNDSDARMMKARQS